MATGAELTYQTSAKALQMANGFIPAPQYAGGFVAQRLVANGLAA